MKAIATLAGRLYTTYSAAIGNKDANGKTLPTWDEFSKTPSNAFRTRAWVEVATQAMKISKDE